MINPVLNKITSWQGFLTPKQAQYEGMGYIAWVGNLEQKNTMAEIKADVLNKSMFQGT